MASSGTVTFNPDLVELFEEAYELAGLEMRGGYQLATARRSFNMLTIEWANRGVNLWTVEKASNLTTVDGTATVSLPADTIDVLEIMVREDSIDYQLNRIGVQQYAQIPDKATEGRPNQYWINRAATPVLNLYPTPNAAYTLVYYRARRIHDAGSYTNTADIPFRFLSALRYGLAADIAMKNPNLVDRLPILQAEYEKQFQLAMEEDREKAPFMLVPGRR